MLLTLANGSRVPRVYVCYFLAAVFLCGDTGTLVQRKTSKSAFPPGASAASRERVVQPSLLPTVFTSKVRRIIVLFLQSEENSRTKILRFFSSAARYVRSRTSKDTNCASGADIDVHDCRCDVSTCKCEELLRARNLDIFVVGRADFDVFHVHTIVAIREDNFHQTRHFRVESAVGDFECEY